MLSGWGGESSGGDSYTGRQSIRSNSRPPGEVPGAGPPPLSIYKYALRNSANLLYWDIRCCNVRHTTHSLWYHLYQNWCLLFVTISYFMHVFDYDQIPLTYFICLCLLINELWNRDSLMSIFVCLHCELEFTCVQFSSSWSMNTISFSFCFIKFACHILKQQPKRFHKQSM